MSMFDTVLEALTEAEVSYYEDRERHLVQCLLQGKVLYRVKCLVVEEGDEWLFCVATFPLSVPTDKIEQAYAKVNQINHDYLCATLIVDPEDGTLLCRFSCPVDGGLLTKEIVLTGIGAAVKCLDKNYEELLKLITD